MMHGPRLAGCQPNLKGRSVLHSSRSPSVNRLSAPRPVSSPSTYCVPISKLRLFWTDVIRCITLYIQFQPTSTPSLPIFNQRYNTGSTSLTKWKKSSRARAPRVRTPPNSSRSRLAKAELGQSPPPIHSPSCNLSLPVQQSLTSVLSPVSFASLFCTSRRTVLFPNLPPTRNARL